ncbi:hypothetical protein BZA05DRAFT_88213 [Tricharina praecox]|uniref:uncharacterized protein n=1 Tax=Tricharina praecox TaxID=43433 RepID=UPI00221E3965|nr:uncharacterized protein BZA05DRAFT_88213 [Tricharina praecox]KAI5848833.1 hypothetical protein BZA05DRAFT_88213 [Tricharina praecox]
MELKGFIRRPPHEFCHRSDNCCCFLLFLFLFLFFFWSFLQIPHTPFVRSFVLPFTFQSIYLVSPAIDAASVNTLPSLRALYRPLSSRPRNLQLFVPLPRVRTMQRNREDEDAMRWGRQQQQQQQHQQHQQHQHLGSGGHHRYYGDEDYFKRFGGYLTGGDHGHHAMAMATQQYEYQLIPYALQVPMERFLNSNTSADDISGSYQQLQLEIQPHTLPQPQLPFRAQPPMPLPTPTWDVDHSVLPNRSPVQPTPSFPPYRLTRPTSQPSEADSESQFTRSDRDSLPHTPIDCDSGQYRDGWRNRPSAMPACDPSLLDAYNSTPSTSPSIANHPYASSQAHGKKQNSSQSLRSSETKNFACPECSKTFTHSNHFKKHQDSHKGKSKPCFLCSGVYTRRDTLLRHLKDQHHLDKCTANEQIDLMERRA